MVIVLQLNLKKFNCQLHHLTIQRYGNAKHKERITKPKPLAERDGNKLNN